MKTRKQLIEELMEDGRKQLLVAEANLIAAELQKIEDGGNEFDYERFKNEVMRNKTNLLRIIQAYQKLLKEDKSDKES